jgi:hypothetical protein
LEKFSYIYPACMGQKFFLIEKEKFTKTLLILPGYEKGAQNLYFKN